MKVQEIIWQLFQPGETLLQKVVRSGVWVTALRATNQGMGLIRTIVLARLLAPDDFGLLGLALLTLAVVGTLTETGFEPALIQRKGKIEDYLHTAWTLSILRGVGLFILLLGLAPFIAAFFDSPRVLAIIQVLALSFLLRGFINIGVVFFQKELEFQRKFTYEVAGTLADFFVAVVAALLLRSVWALVLGVVARGLIQLIASYALHPFRPRLHFEWQQAKELYNFGKWTVAAGILVLLSTWGDDAFVGKVLGITALGFYQMAYKLGNLTASEITYAINEIIYPTYSKLQDNQAQLRQAYLHALDVTLILTCFFALIFVFIGDEIVLALLGEKWLPMGASLKVMAVAGLLRAIIGTSGFLFYAVGQPKLNFLINLQRVIFLALFILPLAYRWDLVGVAMAVLLSLLTIMPYFAMKVGAIVQISLIEFILRLKAPLLSAIGAGLIMRLLISEFRPINLASLATVALLGGTIYLGLVVILAGEQVRGEVMKILRAGFLGG